MGGENPLPFSLLQQILSLCEIYHNQTAVDPSLRKCCKTVENGPNNC